MSPRREVNMPAATEPRVSKGLIAAILGVIAALVAISVLWWVMNHNKSAENATTTTGSSTSAVSEDGVVTVGKGSKVIDVYEDFQCPGCGHFEKNVGNKLGELAKDDDVTIKYHLMNFLDSNFPGDHSTRAANAAYAAADAGVFQKVHDAIYASQPATEGEGWTDEALKKVGKDAGLTGDALAAYEKAIDEKPYGALASKSNDAAFKAGVKSTPTVKVDGKDVDLNAAVYPDVESWLKTLTK